jgi:hypothetical protein
MNVRRSIQVDSEPADDERFSGGAKEAREFFELLRGSTDRYWLSLESAWEADQYKPPASVALSSNFQ